MHVPRVGGDSLGQGFDFAVGVCVLAVLFFFPSCIATECRYKLQSRSQTKGLLLMPGVQQSKRYPRARDFVMRSSEYKVGHFPSSRKARWGENYKSSTT